MGIDAYKKKRREYFKSHLRHKSISNTASKAKNKAMTEDRKKASDFASKALPVMGGGNRDLPFCESMPVIENGEEQVPDYMGNPIENKILFSTIRGIKKYSKHKRLRNIKAFLLNRSFIERGIKEALQNKNHVKEWKWINGHIPETVERIREELKEEIFQIRPYRFRTIFNDGGRKKRHLAILGIYERCVQQVLRNALMTKLRALEPRNVYSSLLERGTLSNNATYCLYGQLKHASKLCAEGYGLKLDIRHCYESISVELVKKELFRYLTDAFARRLVDRLFARIKTLPIGDPLSGLYVNLVLRRWHQHCLQEKHHLFDYCYFFCDDALFLNKKSKKDLHELCHDTIDFIWNYAHLHVKKNYQIYRLKDGITFCGVRVFPGYLRIKAYTKRRMFKKRKNPRSLASYKGILDKTSSGHLSKVLGLDRVSEDLRNYNKKYGNGRVK